MVLSKVEVPSATAWLRSLAYLPNVAVAYAYCLSRYASVIRLFLLIALFLSASLAARAETPSYDGTDVAGLERVLRIHADPSKWRGRNAWRQQAQGRIQRYRKNQVQLIIRDASGAPVVGAVVDAKLIRHQFTFGTVFGVQQFAKVKDVLPYFGSQIGFENALKYKHKDSKAKYLPSVIEWAKERGIGVRGHTLIWPGWRFMHKDSRVFQEGDDAEGLRNFVDRQIIEAAKKWDVTEWDVLNEPLDNQELQAVLGQQSMAQWFKLADEYRRNKDTPLLINENRIISAGPKQEARIARYVDMIANIIARGGPIEGVGVQARFRTDSISPYEVYQRLERLAVLDLPIVATEFEIVDTRPNFSPSDLQRAKMTEAYMTILFSHPKVTGINAWTLLNKLTKVSRHGDRPAKTPDDRGLLNWDMTLPLNGKVWLHLIHQRWHSHINQVSDDAGVIILSGFKGTYEVAVTTSRGTVKRGVFLGDGPRQIELEI